MAAFVSGLFHLRHSGSCCTWPDATLLKLLIATYCENAAHFLYPAIVATVSLIPEHCCSAEIDLEVTISF